MVAPSRSATRGRVRNVGRLPGTTSPPVLPDQREQVIEAPRAYQMVNMLQGVVERGTGQRAQSINKPVAGKTGTTDDSRDAWFIGFTPDMVVGVFVGFDQPRASGTRSKVRAPLCRSSSTS